MISYKCNTHGLYSFAAIDGRHLPDPAVLSSQEIIPTLKRNSQPPRLRTLDSRLGEDGGPEAPRGPPGVRKKRSVAVQKSGGIRWLMDVYGCLWMFMDVHGCSWMFMDVHGCLWMLMVDRLIFQMIEL